MEQEDTDETGSATERPATEMAVTMLTVLKLLKLPETSTCRWRCEVEEAAQVLAVEVEREQAPLTPLLVVAAADEVLAASPRPSAGW